MTKRKARDHLGNEFPSFSEMCRFYDKPISTVFHRLTNSHYSLEQALTEPVHLKLTDHLGNRFETYREMAKHYGVKYNVFIQRLHYEWSLEKALTTPVKVYCKERYIESPEDKSKTRVLLEQFIKMRKKKKSNDSK